MGAFLLAAGEKGKRFCLPNSRVMIHQPMGGFQGQASDIEIHAKEILYLRAPERDAGQAHRPADRAHRARHRPRQLPVGDEAVEYGLVDKVLTRARDEAA
jgi:ATP-dependent Clp protease protease subunit